MRDALYRGELLHVDSSIRSHNEQITFVVPSDGTLVLYAADGQPICASNTVGKTVSQAIVQPDGTFVVYSAFGAVSATDVDSELTANIMAQDNHNAVDYHAHTKASWATNTYVAPTLRHDLFPNIVSRVKTAVDLGEPAG